jgi:tetratricopeptide (TPR) repeat protein
VSVVGLAVGDRKEVSDLLSVHPDIAISDRDILEHIPPGCMNILESDGQETGPSVIREIANRWYREALNGSGRAVILDLATARCLPSGLLREWFPESGVILCNPGSLCGDADDLEVAAEQLLDALAVDPDCVDALNNLGVVAWRQGRIEDAVRWLRRGLDVDARHRDLLNSSCHAKSGDIQRQSTAKKEFEHD